MQLNRSVLALPPPKRAYNMVEVANLGSAQLDRHATIKSASRAARIRFDTRNAQRHRPLVIKAGRLNPVGRRRWWPGNPGLTTVPRRVPACGAARSPGYRACGAGLVSLTRRDHPMGNHDRGRNL